MVDSDKLKGGAVVLILIAALAFFDSYSGHSFSRITGAYYIYGLESRDSATGQTTCTDSDGGKDFYTKGVGTGDYIGSTKPVIYGQEPNPDMPKETDKPYSTYYDFCYNPTQLDEAYCESDGRLGATGYTCTNACKDGACLKPASESEAVKCEKLEMVWYDDGKKETVRFPYVYFPDACAGYRCLNGKEISPACYGKEECSSGCEGKCVSVQKAKSDCTASADCSKGERATIFEGETKRYVTFSGGKDYHYLITADEVASLTALLTVNGTAVQTHEFREFDILGGSKLRTFTTVVNEQPYGMQFCLQAPPAVVIEKGWNIIGGNTLYHKVSTTCGKDQISKTLYAYNPAIKDYDKPELDDNLIPTPAISETQAVWLDNSGEKCEIAADLFPFSKDLGPLTIGPSGWHMLAGLPNWKGKKFSEILTSSCKLFNDDFVGFFYSGESGFSLITTDTIVPSWSVGKGFFIYFVSDECGLKLG